MESAFTSWEDAVRSLLDQPEQRRLVLDCYYDQPVEAAAQRYAESAEWESLIDILPARGSWALDLGAGHGISSYALAQEGWQVVAIEPDDSELVGCGAIRRLANRTGVAVGPVRARAESLPFGECAFDLVFARQAMHHAADLDRFCSEIRRVLKPRGVFIAVRDHVLSNRHDLKAFQQAHPLHHLYGGEQAFTLEEYRSALEGAGLAIRRVLKSFDSPINFAPRTEEEVWAELKRRARLHLLATALSWARRWSPARRGVLGLLSQLDRRPGRLYSFVCQRAD